MLEYLIKRNATHQHFLKHPILPVDGQVSLPAEAGLGMELDETKILKLRELDYG